VTSESKCFILKRIKAIEEGEAMTLILELHDGKEAALKAKAQSRGVSAEEYARQVLDHDLEEDDRSPGVSRSPQEEFGSGMVEENGLLVYRTGNPLPAHVVDEAIYRSRDARSVHRW
jgi:hypothetical protein